MSGLTEDIQELRKTTLFSSRELDDIEKKRKYFQSKLDSYYKKVEDIKAYIQHEEDFLKQIMVRIDRYGHYRNFEQNRQMIENKIESRIKYLYQLGMNISPDCEFSMAYFEFCKTHHFHKLAKTHIEDAVKRFANNSEVWDRAASYFLRNSLQSKHQTEEARSIINRGLQLHPKTNNLYLHALDLELRLGAEYDGQSFHDRATKYTEQFFKNCDDFNLLVDILRILEKYEFTKSVQDCIVTELLKNYSNEVEMWKYIAERENEGFHYTLDETPERAGRLQEALKESKIGCRVIRCIDKYRKGLKAVPPDRKPHLWLLFLDTLMEIQKQHAGTISDFKAEQLRLVLKEASAEVVLEEKHYVAWIESIRNENYLVKVLRKATTALPESLLLWQLRLKYTIKRGLPSDVEKIFKGAREALKERAEPIWFIYISYHCLNSEDDRIKSVYLDGINEHEAVSSIIKPRYIEWLALSQGINEAREAYKSIATKKPYCKELHSLMAKLEANELRGFGRDLEEWEISLKLAYEQFCTSDVEVYLNLIVFYQTRYSGNDKEYKIKQLYEDATRNLPKILYIEFQESCKGLQKPSNHGVNPSL